MLLKGKLIVIFSLALAILDGFLKWWAISHKTKTSELADRFLSFGLHENYGIAFNLPVPLNLVFLITIVIIFILFRLAWTKKSEDSSLSAFALVIAIGALGNFFDRIINGFTTDYLIFFTGTAINISDILIVIGTILLLSYTKHKEHR